MSLRNSTRGCEKTGEPEFKKTCSPLLTGKGVVDLLITYPGVFEIERKGGGALLIELAKGVSLDEMKSKTEATFSVVL